MQFLAVFRVNKVLEATLGAFQHNLVFGVSFKPFSEFSSTDVDIEIQFLNGVIFWF
jgi:hypothetical protein